MNSYVNGFPIDGHSSGQECVLFLETQSFLALFVISFLTVEAMVTGGGKCRGTRSNKGDFN